MEHKMSEIETPAPDDGGPVVLRVKSSSNVSSLAAAVAHAVYAGKDVTLRAIGAGAVNQAVKSLANAQSFVASRAIVLSFRPGFATVKMPEGETTAIIFKVIVG
ncbi:stage V sporulation protein S [Streptosporangium sandarakinum]